MLDSTKPYKPDTSLDDLYDRNLLEDEISKRPIGDPYREVLLQVKKRAFGVPCSIETGRRYLGELTIKVCGAVHESTDCEYGANNCPIRNQNVACLHGLDFRYYGGDRTESRGLNMGNNIWGLRTFALGYVLREQGYKTPQFVDDYPAWEKILAEYDADAAVAYDSFSRAELFADEAHSHRGKEIMGGVAGLQQSLRSHFLDKYVAPTRSAFKAFWNDRVDAKPI